MTVDRKFYTIFFETLSSFSIDLNTMSYNGYNTSEDYQYYLNCLIHNYKLFGYDLDDYLSSSDTLVQKNIFMDLLLKRIETKISPFLNKEYEKVAAQLNTTDNTSFEQIHSVIKYHISFVDAVKNSIIDKKNLITTHQSLNTKTNEVVSISENLTAKDISEKLHIDLSRKEVILSFILLQKLKIIKPGDEAKLKKFIETNFLYTDNSKGKNKTTELNLIRDQYSRLTKSSSYEETLKIYKKLIEKMENLVNNFNTEDFYKTQ